MKPEEKTTENPEFSVISNVREDDSIRGFHKGIKGEWMGLLLCEDFS